MDREIWVENLAGTFFGDADLDGQVVFSDFVALANHFGQAGGWAEGDFDGDQTVTFADFVLPALTFGESKASQPVPEPISGRLLWCLCRLAPSTRSWRQGGKKNPQSGQVRASGFDDFYIAWLDPRRHARGKKKGRRRGSVGDQLSKATDGAGVGVPRTVAGTYL